MAQINDGEVFGAQTQDPWKNILESGVCSDLTLRISYKINSFKKMFQELHVHRIILVAASPVFERMIYGSMNDKDYIDIQENNVVLFHKLLEYIYARDLPDIKSLCTNDIIELMHLAHRYLVYELVELCGNSLMPDSVCDLFFTAFNLAMLFNAKGLIESCTKMIRSQTRQAFHHKNFTMLSAEALVHILKQDELDIETELEVFNAVARWAATYTRHYSGFGSFATSSILEHHQEEEGEGEQEGGVGPRTSSPTAGSLAAPARFDSDVSSLVQDEVTDVDMRLATSVDTGIDTLMADGGDVTHQTDAMTVTGDRHVGVSVSVSVASDDSGHHDDDYDNNNESGDFCADAAEYGAHLREILKKSGVFGLIRFLAFAPGEFADHVATRHVLNCEEISFVLLSLNTPKQNNNDHQLQLQPQMTDDNDLPAPSGICLDARPRSPSPLTRHQPHPGDPSPHRCHGVSFAFLHPHWLACSAYGDFQETFVCRSSRPVLIETVLIPPKQKVKPTLVTQNYEEELRMTLYVLDANGDLGKRIAAGVFKVRRKYFENHEYKLAYNLTDPGVVLVDGTRFSVVMCFAKAGHYLGGFGYTDECGAHDVIGVPDDKHRGLIQGFTYSFIEQ